MPPSPETDCLVAPHREWLLRLIRSRLSGTPLRDAAEEDVLQEVALAALRSNKLPTADDQLRRWLCRLALRQCALALRQGVRRQGVVDRAGEQLHAHVSPVNDPIHWLIADEDGRLLRQAVARLDEGTRRVIVWKYVDRLTYAQIGQRLGVSRHSVEHRIVKARQLLRRYLTDMGLRPEGNP